MKCPCCEIELVEEDFEYLVCGVCGCPFDDIYRYGEE